MKLIIHWCEIQESQVNVIVSFGKQLNSTAQRFKPSLVPLQADTMNWTVGNSSVTHLSVFCRANEPLEKRESVISAYLVIIVSVLISIAAVILNFLICYVITTNSHLRTPSGILVLFMAITDFLTGIVTVPLSIARQSFFIMETLPPCLLGGIFRVSAAFLTMITLFLLALLSVDRYLHAVYSRKTSGWKLTRKYTFLFALMWLFAIGFMTPFPLEGSYQKIAPALGFGIATFSVSCIVFTHTKVCLFLLKTGRVVPGSSVQPSADFRRRWVRKSVVTLIIIIVVFTICCIPRTIYIVLSYLNGPARYLELHTWSATVLFFNSAANPIIYLSRSSNVRRIINRYIDNLRQSWQGSENNNRPL